MRIKFIKDYRRFKKGRVYDVPNAKAVIYIEEKKAKVYVEKYEKAVIK